MSFPCTGCGACCHRINIAVANIPLLPNEERFKFPYSWDASGKCEMLDENNRCKVYDHRPLICNIDKMIEELDLDKELAYKDTIKICNQFMDEDGIPKSFMIKTTIL